MLIIIQIIRSQLHLLCTNNAMYHINMIFSVKPHIMSVIRRTRDCKYNTIKFFLLNVFDIKRVKNGKNKINRKSKFYSTSEFPEE